MTPNDATAGLGRRGFLKTSAAVAAGLALPTTAARHALAAPAQVRAGRPSLPSGIQIGDVTSELAIIWARADRAARMLVEVADNPEFRGSDLRYGPVVTPDSDCTGKMKLRDLAAGQEHFIRVSFADLDDRSLRAEPVLGSFHAAPAGGSQPGKDIRFLWSGDMVGQGWGINPELGGIKVYEVMRQLRPDFYINSGDTIYADGPLAESVVLPDGRVWRNLVIEEKLKVAETLVEYRGQYKYNLMDTNVRAFNAEVPVIAQWDDHETTNNWYPGEILADDRYTEKRVDVLAQRARQAFFEYQPITPRGDSGQDRVWRKQSHGPLLDVFVIDMRTYRDANSTGLAGAERILGRQQARWLTRELERSTATWKVIASDMPLGLIVPDGDQIEGIANRDPGLPGGREVEVAEILRSIKHNGVKNVVWVTADVHYTAAHHYDPSRAAFKDFDPFWEFVSGPINAGAFGPNVLDATFGPEAVFVKAPPRANTSPLEGFQFFGQVDIDADSRVLTATLKDLEGTALWSKELHPA